MEKYIESDLKNNPQFFEKPHSGKFVDISVVRHVVCNVNRPEDVPVGAFASCMNAVAAEVDMIPSLEDVVPVVRCLECKHYKENRTKKYGNLICRCTRMGKYDMDYPVKPDDFCSYGEKAN